MQRSEIQDHGFRLGGLHPGDVCRAARWPGLRFEWGKVVGRATPGQLCLIAQLTVRQGKTWSASYYSAMSRIRHNRPNGLGSDAFLINRRAPW